MIKNCDVCSQPMDEKPLFTSTYFECPVCVAHNAPPVTKIHDETVISLPQGLSINPPGFKAPGSGRFQVSGSFSAPGKPTVRADVLTLNGTHELFSVGNGTGSYKQYLKKGDTLQVNGNILTIPEDGPYLLIDVPGRSAVVVSNQATGDDFFLPYTCLLPSQPNPSGRVTGRWSSSQPNVQQIPRTPDPGVRKAPPPDTFMKTHIEYYEE